MPWHYGMGYGWFLRRAAYELRLRSGLEEAIFPRRPWARDELGLWLRPELDSRPEAYAAWRRRQSTPFFFRPADRQAYRPLLKQAMGTEGGAALAALAEDLGRGRFPYFFGGSGDLGWPPDWRQNPLQGGGAPGELHWRRIPMFAPGGHGDLKFVWEPARFAAAFILARAYWASGDERHPETFWRLVESWREANPPNQGPHWKCGQEMGLRLMAWCFALHAFLDSPATTPERLAWLAAMTAAQAERISRGRLYAELQRNNHAVAEANALWTVGLVFPELARASLWRRQGREALAALALDQFDPDGSYIQNSHNYHRVALQHYVWAQRLGQMHGQGLPEAVLARVAAAVRFLWEQQDEATGRVPCYGPDDGALILPINACQYQDFRPAVGAGHYLLHGQRLFAPGCWQEDLLWLFGPEALDAPPARRPRQGAAFTGGGYYVLRGERAHAVLRCHTYRWRPAQADMLHLDLWWRGVNLVCDPGTYLYYAPPPWDNSLSGTAVHSTLCVAGRDQMRRGRRFLWSDWTRSQVLALAVSPDRRLECFQGQHWGYAGLAPPVVHRRAVLRAGDDLWLVVDDLLGQGNQPVFAHWLLPPAEHRLAKSGREIALELGPGPARLLWAWRGLEREYCDLSQGREEHAPRGWRAPGYGRREPALSLRTGGRGRLPARLVTAFVLGEGPGEMEMQPQRVVVRRGPLRLEAELGGLSRPEQPGLAGARLELDGETTLLSL